MALAAGDAQTGRLLDPMASVGTGITMEAHRGLMGSVDIDTAMVRPPVLTGLEATAIATVQVHAQMGLVVGAIAMEQIAAQTVSEATAAISA